MVAYMFNKFPDGFFEILAASLLQRENNISRGLYSDIIKLINDYTVFLEEHIKYCIANNKIVIFSNILLSISDIKNRLSNIEDNINIVYSYVIRDILQRRYRIYKNKIKSLDILQ